jgi:hypothetical protein
MKKFFMFNIATLIIGYFISQMFVSASAEETVKLLCDDPVKMEQVLTEKGYFHLLDMKNENGVYQQLWTGGRSMVITATKDKKICLLTTADEVTYNPVTLQKIIEVFKKSQKEL